MKTCKKCLVDKPFEAFHRDSKAKDGLQTRCKPCHIAAVGASQRKNPEVHNAATRKYRAEHPERHKASEVAWRAANPELSRELDAAKSRRWRAAHPAKVREITTRSHRVRRQATPAWADKQAIAKVYEKALEWGFEVDHVVPLNSKIVSGLHVPANLQLLDSQLNKAKHNFTWPDMP